MAAGQATHLPESQHAPNLPCIDAKVTLNSLHQEEETEQGGSAVLETLVTQWYAKAALPH